MITRLEAEKTCIRSRRKNKEVCVKQVKKDTGRKDEKFYITRISQGILFCIKKKCRINVHCIKCIRISAQTYSRFFFFFFFLTFNVDTQALR